MLVSHSFKIGQRWLSNSETDLGLGVVVSTDNRSVKILFPAVGQERTYAIAQAPVTRLVLSEGEQVKHVDGWTLQIDKIELADELYVYSGVRTDTGEASALMEISLDHQVKLNQPEKRLFSGQLDSPKWFDIRFECLEKQYKHATSGAVGLLGARVDLIPHQLHIANSVGQRHAPRVLLADEVGLGKTIEAALILHQQILTGKASRALIIVPNSLVHQWLVEMLRRVNLAFSVFDDERIAAAKESQENAFEQEQLVLCSLDFVMQTSVLAAATAVNWDMLIVDEAHHLAWTQDAPSDEYQAVEKLCGVSNGVLLLTATPDQLGHQSHFARLRLLDPARFHDYQSFVEEEQSYTKLAQVVSPLIDDHILTQTQVDELVALTGDSSLSVSSLLDDEEKHRLLRKLIDQHGTGRLLFRNTRHHVQGFPQRILNAYPLSMPKEYKIALDLEDDWDLSLHPERCALVNTNWTKLDPRVEWLIDLLENYKDEKVLVICAYASTALQLAEHLRTKTSIRHSVFHEGMSIVERDKAAHYFASDEQGAQVLLCSEIGSEGRNFQFSRHLCLFDLPINPDLLEQRIGRLDRIGQKHDIQLHVPYFEQHAQHILFDWYSQGLQAFEHTCPIGAEVFSQIQADLIAAMQSPADTELSADVIAQSHYLAQELKQKIEQGRDRLLELNASGFGNIDTLLDTIVEAENPVGLYKFMTRLFDTLGVMQEDKDEYSFILKPTEQLAIQIPGLDEDGLEVTYQRATATKFEHYQFLTWDSQLVQRCLDTVTSDVLGKSSMAFCRDPDMPTGAFFIEVCCVLQASANPALQLSRFLPPTPVRICIDAKGELADLSLEPLHKVKPKIAQKLLLALQTQISQGIEQALELGKQELMSHQSEALQQMQQSLGDEIERLSDLQKHNPSIRDEEIQFIVEQQQQLTAAISQADLYLDAVRIIVNNP